MVVQTYAITPGQTGLLGLLIGASNVQEHFPRGVEAIELELDHLCILCPLAASFWEDRPEIRDRRLSLWLEAKRMGGKLAAAPASMGMIPCGQQAFRLEILQKGAADYALTTADEGEMASAARLPLPAPAQTHLIAPVIAPLIAFDRRKHAVAHHPERRRIGRLKDNDSSSSAANH
ncbi:MAG TPA: hypothetical protein VL346_04885 [Acidobacteriaceae bacterium]|nr:hypothetical protein [Acidobacteriaceae bacterium]